MNTIPEPEPWVLDDVDTPEALTAQLNEQADESRLVLAFASSVEGDVDGDGVNRITYAIENPGRIKKLGKLGVEPVPAGATAADADRADTIEARRAVKDAYLKFISPLLEDHVALCRAEVFINKKKVEVVLLREAEPYQPSSLNGKILQGGPGWEWLVAEVVGDDIVVRGAMTTAFGGTNDPQDGGATACGYPTAGHPGLRGCALPLGGYAASPAEIAALGGTPLPKMPFGLDKNGNERPEGAHVEVTDPKSGKKITVPVIDLGPAKRTKHALDLSVAAAREFNASATARNFSMVLDYRILKGALALPADQRTPAPVTVSSTAPAGNNKLIFEAARKNAGTLSTANAPGTDGGKLACAWVVNEIVKIALGHPIGGDASTAEMYGALKAGKGKEVAEKDVTPGTVIISPTVSDAKHGHVGIMGEAGRIYSNSSADAKWEQNFNLEGWKAYYRGRKGLGVYFYCVA